MPDRFDLHQWAEQKVTEHTATVKGLIDCGMDLEDAVDYVFDRSILATSYKMRILENVGNYRHEHRFVLDAVTGRNWCATCQKFEDIKQ